MHEPERGKKKRLLFSISNRFSPTRGFWWNKNTFFGTTGKTNPRNSVYFKRGRTHLAEIDDMISKNLKGWAKERISKIDLAILRLAIYEICFSQEIPPGVAVNEAVELAKEFSTEEAPAFINGVLGSIIKKVQ